MKWITADLHLGHKNIIKPTYSDRPFKNVDEMNFTIINNINSIVKPKDTIIILGDFALAKKKKVAYWISLINGYKILILGNHDRQFLQREFKSQKLQHYRDLGFDEVYGNMLILNKMILVHHPIFIEGKVTLNVGVDKWNFYPIPLPSDKDLILCGHVHRKWLVKVK